MKKELSEEDKKEVINVAIGAAIGVVIGIIVIGTIIGGIALYSYIKYWR